MNEEKIFRGTTYCSQCFYCSACQYLNATILDTFGHESTLVHHGSRLRLTCDCLKQGCRILSIQAPDGSTLISNDVSVVNSLQVEVNISSVSNLGAYACSGMNSSGKVFQQTYTLSYKLCKYCMDIIICE